MGTTRVYLAIALLYGPKWVVALLRLISQSKKRRFVCQKKKNVIHIS